MFFGDEEKSRILISTQPMYFLLCSSEMTLVVSLIGKRLWRISHSFCWIQVIFKPRKQPLTSEARCTVLWHGSAIGFSWHLWYALLSRIPWNQFNVKGEKTRPPTFLSKLLIIFDYHQHFQRLLRQNSHRWRSFPGVCRDILDVSSCHKHCRGSLK